MIPAFDLHRADSVGEATALLDRYGDEATLYAGGTELLLIMKLGLADYSHLVDVKRLAPLRTLSVGDGRLRVGAAMTHREIEHAAAVRSSLPALATMTSNIANLRVRGTGTIGGNLCFADPHSDSATFLLAAGAEALLQRGEQTERRLPIVEFLVDMFSTALEPGELLLAVEVPVPGNGTGIAHERFVAHERPLAVVTAWVQLDGARVSGARVAVGAVAPRPVRAADAEHLLIGTGLDAVGSDLFEAAGEAAAAEVEPMDDGEGSVAYKRQLVRTLVGRSLRAAVADALTAGGT